SFCIGCHQRSGVALDAPGGNPSTPTTGSIRFHPEGWVSYSCFGTVRCFENNPNHHAWQAQRNIRACASCHREQSCIACHSSYNAPFNDPALNPGFKGIESMGSNNPHPPGWLGSGKCRALLARNKRVCLKCHPGNLPINCDNQEL